MKKFELFISGRNFLLKKDDRAKKLCFYAARFVEAEDLPAAVEVAMDLIRTELKDLVLNDQSDPPTMKLEEVSEVYYFQDRMEVGNILLPGNGFLWREE